jgi:predicted acyltransferase
VLLVAILLKCLNNTGKTTNMTTVSTPVTPLQRLTSLDFMRGLIMVLLALEAAGLYDSLYDASKGLAAEHIMEQFHHHPWNGLRFWDLIQPAFMFMAGTAMAYSVAGMKSRGVSQTDRTIKILKRCGWLFFWGVLNYAVRKKGLSFELWNVLTQLSFTILVAYFIFEWGSLQQILFCAGILLLTEFLYRYTGVPGFDQPFTDQQNFGNYVDMLLMNKINKGGWVAINCLPTAVHTIAGALVGKMLMDPSQSKIRTLGYWGLGSLLLGYGLDWLSITPIIKKIATTSFTISSLGWCLLLMATCYYLIDIKGRKNSLSFFLVIGMNSIFIYLFFEIVGARWFNGYINAIVSGIFSGIMPELIVSVLGSLTIFLLEWGLCLFLFRKKIFFRL